MILEAFYEQDPDWHNKTIEYINKLVNLDKTQIYKWGYEKMRKVGSWSRITVIKTQKKVEDLCLKDLYDESYDFNRIVDWLWLDHKFKSEKLTKEEKQIYKRIKEETYEKIKLLKCNSSCENSDMNTHSNSSSLSHTDSDYLENYANHLSTLFEESGRSLLE